jgi:hypothetical protein
VPRCGLFEGDEPVVRLLDGEALSLQACGDGLGDGSLVLDDQDAGFVAHPSRVESRWEGPAQML